MEKAFITQELFEHLRGLNRCDYDEHGRELCNPVPLEVDVSLQKPLSLKERVQRLLRNELSQQVSAQGFETFEESQDFDVYDDFDVPEALTPYEATLMAAERPLEPGENPSEERPAQTSQPAPSSSPENPENPDSE